MRREKPMPLSREMPFRRLMDPIGDARTRKLPEYMLRFARAKERQPALAAFADDTAAAAFAKDSKQHIDARSAVLRAFITEYQKERHPIWSTCILATLHAPLVRVADACRDLPAGRDDIGQRVTEIALEEVLRHEYLRPEVLLFHRLPQRVFDRMVRDVKREKKRRTRTGSFTSVFEPGPKAANADEDLDPEDVIEAPSDPHPERAFACFVQLCEIVTARLPVESWTLLLQGPRAFVDELIDSGAAGDLDDQAQKRLYQARKRKRTRMYEDARELAEEAGLFERFGPAPAVAWLGIG